MKYEIPWIAISASPAHKELLDFCNAVGIDQNMCPPNYNHKEKLYFWDIDTFELSICIEDHGGIAYVCNLGNKVKGGMNIIWMTPDKLAAAAPEFTPFVKALKKFSKIK